MPPPAREAGEKRWNSAARDRLFDPEAVVGDGRQRRVRRCVRDAQLHGSAARRVLQRVGDEVGQRALEVAARAAHAGRVRRLDASARCRATSAIASQLGADLARDRGEVDELRARAAGRRTRTARRAAASRRAASGRRSRRGCRAAPSRSGRAARRTRRPPPAAASSQAPPAACADRARARRRDRGSRPGARPAPRCVRRARRRGALGRARRRASAAKPRAACSDDVVGRLGVRCDEQHAEPRPAVGERDRDRAARVQPVEHEPADRIDGAHDARRRRRRRRDA